MPGELDHKSSVIGPVETEPSYRPLGDHKINYRAGLTASLTFAAARIACTAERDQRSQDRLFLLIRCKRIRRDLVDAAKLYDSAHDVNRSLIPVRITDCDKWTGIRTEPLATGWVALRRKWRYLNHVPLLPAEFVQK